MTTEDGPDVPAAFQRARYVRDHGQPDPRQCVTAKGPKDRHESRRRARTALKHLQAKSEFRPPPAGKILGVYRCEICRSWHIGAQDVQ